MTSYDIIGKLVLGFIVDDEQQDYLLDSGVVETDGRTIWFTNGDGERFKSITTANVVEIGLGLGVLRLRGGTVIP